MIEKFCVGKRIVERAEAEVSALFMKSKKMSFRKIERNGLGRVHQVLTQKFINERLGVLCGTILSFAADTGGEG